MHKEKMLRSEPVFDGVVIKVRKDIVELENGKEGYREVVHHNGGAGVIAIDAQDNIYLVRQYRYALAQELIEIPAGKLELGEDPFCAAQRELGEEAGVTAETYADLGYIIPTCGYCDEKIYLYAAKGLARVAQHLDEDEFVSVFSMPLAEAVQRVLSNEITDSKTVAAILKLDALKRAEKF